ncbi:MAG: type II toxin-antitoxin system antitoxin SocA domain-containing protein [Planctomycetota bacterium]
MATVLQVSDYLAFLSQTDGEPEPLSPKKLQKLLYYAQGLSVAKTGQPLFPEKIEAWLGGPVVPIVWREYKECGCSGIVNRLKDAGLSLDERVFLRQVWRLYGKFTGAELSVMTHREAPWQAARQGLPQDAKNRKEIPLESLAEFFSKQNIELPAVPRPVAIRKGREVYRIEDAGKLLPAGI